MNLKDFTELVDQSVDELSKEALLIFIHGIARKVPEKSRSEFLEMLYNIQENSYLCGGEKCLKAVIRNVDEKDIKAELDRLSDLFCQIEEEELYMQAEYNEDYGDWGDDGEWEYEDPMGVCQIYDKGYQFLLNCVNIGFYTEACEMFDLLLDTEVLVDNDWDSFTIGLEDLTGSGQVSIDLPNLALHTLYAVYQTSPKEERARSLHVYFKIHFFEKIHVEDILSLGRYELEDLPEFWDSWIELLSNVTGDKEVRLLKEAINFQGEPDKMLDVAQTAYEKHPSLYVEVLKGLEQSHNYEGQLSAGKEALEKIDKKYVLRSEIALKTAEAAIGLGEEEYAEYCWMLALESYTTPVNFLRVMTESVDSRKCRETAVKIIRLAKQGVNERYGFVKELEENSVSKSDLDILWFLSGRFDGAMGKCREVKQSLGWSGKFVKCGIALFLLLLFKEDKLKQGCIEMAQKVIGEMNFNASSYYSGTKYYYKYRIGEMTDTEKREVFWECVRRWKKRFCLSEEQSVQYLLDLEWMIDKRVVAIVSGKFRAHYESVAALAAALGEVKESMGDTDAKQRILQKYRSKFPRHSAFHEALRKYGMLNTRSF